MAPPPPERGAGPLFGEPFGDPDRDDRTVAVALPVPLDEPFHYRVPPALRDDVAVGQAVHVPFGRRALIGLITELDPTPPADVELRPLRALVTREPLFDGDDLSLLRWVARYYRHPLGQVIGTALPPGLAAAREDDDRPVQPPAAWAPQTVEVVRLTGSLTAALSAFARPGAVRDRLLAYLDRFGEVEVPHLVEQFGGARRVLRQLRERGLVELEAQERPARGALDGARGAMLPDGDTDEPPTLTDDQRAAIDTVGARLGEGFGAFLLYGVTGSGKTEVYLRLARQALDAGRGVLVLVPEIALTPQLVSRFAARLQQPLAVLHSGLTARQRLQRWRALHTGAARVAIGPRSAVFAPVAELGLVIVDEEHDGSYKQDDGLRYHARDVAVMRAVRRDAVVVLGSATPSLESMHNADTGKYTRVELPTRVQHRPMPDVTVVDLRAERAGDEESDRLLTPTLLTALEETVARDEQAILLLNRRGLSTLVVCGGCGGEFRCPDCEVALTYHGRQHRLRCHHCGRSRPLPDRCPHCRADALELLGEGTERVEEALARHLPGLRVDRMDRDTTGARGSHERLLERFRRGEVQVLVGTQMVAKGHDFPRVTLVGVLHADASLRLPDFRAGERTFSLLTQVAGRAGRADLPGRVIVQTFVPEHDAIRFALDHDHAGYAARLLRSRSALGYPPFGRLALLRLSHPRDAEARRAARALGDALREGLRGLALAGAPRLRLLGPSPSPLSRIAGRSRWQVLLLAPDPRSLARALDTAGPALRRLAKVSSLRVGVDVDPQSLL